MGRRFDFSDWDEVGSFVDAELASPGWHVICIRATPRGGTVYVDGGAT